ncbi:MAG: ketoacyl-ACP synthase III [Deltaproteobacteria bacterium]|nr:ketoacyl-ACP synthase III [Deltaproteobacteria bacterium]
MGTLYVHGLGHFHPETIIDNRFLESLDIGTTDEWIIDRTGIRERRTVLPLDYIRATKNSDVRAAPEAAIFDNAETGRRAAILALERARLCPSDIGLVIAGGCCSDFEIPADACRIAAALGIEAPALDLNSACSSFGAQLHFLSQMNALPPFVLVVNPENTTRAVDYADRSTAVLWGDGSSAAIVSSTVSARVRVVETTLGSSPSDFGAVSIPRFGHFRQEGSRVQRFAIRTTLACIEPMLPGARERSGRFRFIGHQANLAMLEGVIRRASIASDEHWFNVHLRGNTGAAGAPSVLSERWEDLCDGDDIAMAVVGSGLTWASLRLEVGNELR